MNPFVQTSIGNFTLCIPDNLIELSDDCFIDNPNIKRVIFGKNSQLVRISVSVFEGTSIESLSIPDSVVELDDSWFSGSEHMREVIFGPGSNLERIGNGVFLGTTIEISEAPEHLREMLKQHCPDA